MVHSIEIWQSVVTLAEERLPVLMPAAAADLPAPGEGDDVLIELSRQFPALSREIAAYLAR